MNKEDNIQIQMRHFKMENVRLHGEVSRLSQYAVFLEEENKTIESEVRAECQVTIDMLSYRVEVLAAKVEAAENRAASESRRADEEAAKAAGYEKEISGLKEELKKCKDLQKIADAAKEGNMDYKDILEVIKRRTFQRNSDATRFLNGEIDPNDPFLEETGFEEVIKTIMERTSEEKRDTSEKKPEPKKVKFPRPGKKRQKKEAASTEASTGKRKRRVYDATVLKQMGIDTSNLPAGSKLIRRKDKDGGEDVWYIRLIYHKKAQVICREYKIGRFNVPGEDPANSKYPDRILEDNPVMPSFARFYFESKFAFGLSENRILEMLKSMKTRIPQSSLNRWMHQIMIHLRERLEPLILAAIKQSKFTNNDGTRLLVRSRDEESGNVSYSIKYIQAALSLEKKLVVMLYDEGSRGHEVQEEKIFKDSNIECFVADRLSVYQAIVEDLEDQHLQRQACWFHGRHYLVDAYLVDHRVEDVIKLINLLFYIERVFQGEDDTSPEARLAFRKRWSKRIVDRIMERLEKIRKAGSDYGAMVHRAVNYILDDREAFERFLSDGRIDMHNIAIERCFRHIAIGRRNWLHTGSHKAAQNIAFMFGLYESCKLNNV
ncbi:MAG: transposase, partial [Candidatus Cryptobacteroides sp.]